MRIGFPKAAICLMISSAWLVGRSSGDISSLAMARQWMQRRLQPLVTSQKIRRAWNSFAAPVGELPLPSAMLALLSVSAIPARIHWVNDRILRPGGQCVLSLGPVICVTVWEVREAFTTEARGTGKGRGFHSSFRASVSSALKIYGFRGLRGWWDSRR